MLIVNDRIRIPLREFNFTFARSSGPGGQNVNKVNTKATLHWDVTRSASLPDDVRQRFFDKFKNRINREGQLVLASQRFRDQGRNVADCLAKLREMIEQVLQAPLPRKKPKLSRAAKARRRADKRVAAQKKEARRPPTWD
jgi:ribosome-associated protein